MNTIERSLSFWGAIWGAREEEDKAMRQGKKEVGKELPLLVQNNRGNFLLKHLFFGLSINDVILMYIYTIESQFNELIRTDKSVR